MMKGALILLAAVVATNASAAEAAARSGAAYAVVEVDEEDGSLDVRELRSDLPMGAETVVRDWLVRQAIEFPIDSNRTTVKIDYAMIEADEGRQAMDMNIAATGVELPRDVSAITPLDVEIRLRGDGTVTNVTPLGNVPQGISEEAIANTVRESIENDPAIREAARRNSLREGIHVITVNIRPADER